jgi:hypothetical protein
MLAVWSDPSARNVTGRDLHLVVIKPVFMNGRRRDWFGNTEYTAILEIMKVTAKCDEYTASRTSSKLRHHQMIQIVTSSLGSY